LRRHYREVLDASERRDFDAYVAEGLRRSEPAAQDPREAPLRFFFRAVANLSAESGPTTPPRHP
jgi:hypothetical protein